MGAYSPAPVVTPNVHARVMHEIILPTIAGMAADGMPFTGFLYAGLMIDAHGEPQTVEFNCRLGDPETQPILMRLKSDLFDVLMQATAPTASRSTEVELQWDRRVALGVVMAAARLSGRRRAAATRSPACRQASRRTRRCSTPAPSCATASVVTAGGRVLCVTALGDSTRLAQQRAYDVRARHPLRRRAVPRATSASARIKR